MHYNFLLRGNYYDVERMIHSLSHQKFYLPIQHEGKTIMQPVDGRVEVILPISYVFPKQYQDMVLTSLGATEENRARWYGTGLKNKTIFTALQLAMWSKPIPKFTPTEKKLLLDPELMNKLSFMPIGIKEDVDDFMSPNGAIHEAL